MKKFISVIVLTLLVLVAVIKVSEFKSNADIIETEPGFEGLYNVQKNYTSITIGAGETLSTISEKMVGEYCNSYFYDSYKEYMEEVATINSLRNINSIHYGEKIVVPYYIEAR